MKKRILSTVCALVLVFGSAGLEPSAPLFNDITAAAAGQTIAVNAEEVTIYAVSTGMVDYVTIPSNVNQSFQIKVTGAQNVTYSIDDYWKYVTVSDTGLVEPLYKTRYHYNGFSTSIPVEDKELLYTTTECSFGDNTITVKADGQTFKVKVHFKDYTDIAAEQKMNEIYSKNFNSSMSKMEVLQKATQYAAENFDYGSSSTVRGLVLIGAGDCWANSAFIIDICRRAGVEAYMKVATDEGASGHMNVIAKIDNKYYVAEAGTAGNKPRYYQVREAGNLFHYSRLYDDNGQATGNASVYQYIAPFDEKLTIPYEYDGVKFTRIQDNFAARSSPLKWFGYPEADGSENLKELTVSEGIEYIGKEAFEKCKSLETVYIPSTVTEIGANIFYECTALKNIVVAAGNSRYSVSGGCLIEDKTKVIDGIGAGSVTIPEGVTEIAEEAFADKTNLKCRVLTLPSTIETIGKSAFHMDEYIDHAVINGSKLKRIEYGTFWSNSNYNYIKSVTVPESVEYIDLNAFRRNGYKYIYTGDSYHYAYMGLTVVGKKGSYAESYANENDYPFIEHGKEVIVSGKVTSCKGALPDHQVVFIDEDGNAFADNTGKDYYSLMLERGKKYRVVAYADGYSYREYEFIAGANESEKTLDIELHIPGDVNGDDKVNIKDVMLIQQSIVGWNVMLDKSSADVNKDKKVNIKDVMLIQQKIVGWNVTLE